MAGALRPCCFTGLSRADLDPLHLMYLMVVVVAAVDAVEDVSLTQSETIWRCAYRCEEQEITREGSWDELPDDAALPLIIPRLSSPRSTFSTTFSPLVQQAHSLAAAVLHWPVDDRLEACDQRRTLSACQIGDDQALVITNDPSEVQRPDACCLIRFVSSVTWLNTLRRSAIRVRILRSACITVVWSLPPNCCPILGSDKSVSSRHRYIAI
jgi:hypothetical protein